MDTSRCERSPVLAWDGLQRLANKWSHLRGCTALSLAVWVRRCYMVETSTIGPWVVWRIWMLAIVPCMVWYAFDFCMTVTSQSHSHLYARSHRNLRKDMNISKYPTLRKPPINEGPLLHKILQYIMAHLPKEMLPTATLCLYLDYTKQDLKLN